MLKKFWEEEYKGYLIRIYEEEFRDEKTGIMLGIYYAHIIDENSYKRYKWVKNYSRARYSLDDVERKAKLRIDKGID